MRVICKTNTRKLVKGATYEVVRLWNTSSTSRPRISIKGIGTFITKNFTQIDGTPLPQIDWVDKSIEQRPDNPYIKDPENLKKGDVLVCKWDSKYLCSGKKYRISEVRVTDRKYTSSSYKETKIKIEGFNTWLNPYRFRYPNTEESRDLSLNEIFDNPEKLSIDKSIRKIDTMDESKRKKVILSCIFQSMLDPYRNNLTTLEWTVQKSGRKWDIKDTDIEPYLNLKLSDIIEQIS
jgi:hypothetical protein